MPSVVTFRAALYLQPTSPSSLLVLLMQHGGEPFFGASFAPPAIPSVVTFRAALYLRPTSLSSLLVLLMQYGGSTAHVPLLSSRARRGFEIRGWRASHIFSVLLGAVFF